MKDLETQRDKLTTRAFLLSFELLFIFGVPAFLAVVLGRRLSVHLGQGDWLVYTLLAAAFVGSWVIFLCRLKKVSRDIKNIQEKIKESKAESDK